MSDNIRPDNEKQFAIDLENELESRRRNDQTEEHQVKQTENSISDRIEKVKPTLDLLLEFKDQADLFVSEAATETANLANDVTFWSQVESPIPNLQRLGRFQLEQELGRGGNGIVYQASDLQLDRTVALKIPRLSSALSGEAKSRFEREAKAAAGLHHPGIVAVYEVGHEQGVDYIVSQFVDGISLSQWLDSNSAHPRESASAVAFLADAMHHAHSRGVLHRDLKPSNVILENNQNDIPFSQRPRIVDFGLAVIKADVSEDLTTTGSIIGTPAYMSPEQTRSHSESIGTATDVYGLGVILYQLLTGKPPFIGNDLIQIVEKVRNEDPICPSQINRDVPKDLAAITSKCLEKRSEDRYASTAELQADLNRFLNNETVLARPASTSVRLKKWIQRNPWVSALILSLFVGVAATSYAAVRATNAETQSRLSAAKTKNEAEKVAAVSEYLEEMFRIPSYLARKKNQLQGKDVTAEQILRHAADKIKDDLESQPQVKARLMTIIGSSLIDIASFEEAEGLLRAGLELNQLNLDSTDPKLAKSHFELGRCLRKIDQVDEAQIQLQAAIEILERDVAENHRLLSNCYNDLGILFRPTDPAVARQWYCKARDLIETYQPNEKENWTLSANIGVLDYLGGNYDLAVETFEHTLELATRSLGEAHPKVATVLGNLSRAHMRLGRFKKAEQLRQRAVDIISNELGPDHVDLGIALIGLANVHQRSGAWEKAFHTEKQALQILRAGLPPHHRQTISATNNHIATLIRMNKLEEALSQTKSIEEADVQRVGDNLDFTSLRNQLLISQVERMSGDFESAKKRIDLVSNHHLTKKNGAIYHDALFANALYLADSGAEDAEKALNDALNYSDSNRMLNVEDRHYMEAVFWSLYGNPMKAIEKLSDALDCGYSDARILGDPDLRPLEGISEFSEIQAAVKRDLLKD